MSHNKLPEAEKWDWPEAGVGKAEEPPVPMVDEEGDSKRGLLDLFIALAKNKWVIVFVALGATLAAAQAVKSLPDEY